MSANEEPQSTNEELETLKEESHSINEELTTVRHELQDKVAELEHSNNDLANLLASTHVPTLFLDRQLLIKRFTPDATHLFSLIASDIGRPLSDITSRCDVRSLLADAQRVLDELTPIQHHDVTDEGEHYLRRTMPYRTGEDRIEGVVVTFADVTELQRAAQSARRLATVVRGSSDSIIVHDLQGRVQAWNHGAEVMYGYTEAQALGMDIGVLVAEKARDAWTEAVARVLKGDAPMQAVHTRRSTRDGRLLDVSVSMSLIPGDESTPACIALIGRNITHYMQAEADLRASEERFRTLADSAPVLIWTSDAQERIEFANKECTQAVGQSVAQLLGRSWTDLLHPDDMPAVRIAMHSPAGAAGSDRREATARVLMHDGAPRWMKITVIARPADSRVGSGQVGCMVDIHAQVEAQAMLSDADRRKDEFMAMLGHELRNPLAPVRNAAELLSRMAGDDTRLVWVRDVLVRQVDHVNRLVDDLLDISRIARGMIALEREPVDMRVVIEQAVEGVEPLLQRKRHTFGAMLPDESLWVEGDAVRLIQVVYNLLLNAVKYTDSGGEVTVQLQRDRDTAVLHVRDNGIGIEHGMEARIFDLFVQNQRSLDRSQGGLGVGLPLVKRLVQLHGGEVAAYSSGLGHGSDFEVRLPALAGAAASAPEPPAPPSGHGRVLIVDDDPENAETLAMVLRLDGFEVETADGLETALQTAPRLRPQVVITDLAMPGADGYEVMQRLSALPGLRESHYIALSGFGSPEDQRHSLESGFTRHFVKPVDIAQLEAALDELIGSVNRPDAKASS